MNRRCIIMGEPIMMKTQNSVFLRDETLVLIDRRKLPHTIEEVICTNYEETAMAIEKMVVQGAGDIAIAAGYGLYLAAAALEKGRTFTAAEPLLFKAKQRLTQTRPTGYHLAALLEKLYAGLNWENPPLAKQIRQKIEHLLTVQQNRSETTGRWGATLLEDQDTILTHCFPGSALLYMLKDALQAGKNVKVVATETRPYLQGARLTAWSVSQLNVPVTLITDNMAAYCMEQGMIKKVFTAADRIALDGTIANKIGTLQLALLADHFQVPFYILGYGGPDRSCPDRHHIPIEIRAPEEVLHFAGIRITGTEVAGFYPAFDITPPQLINKIITDRGLFDPQTIFTYPRPPSLL